MILYDHFDGKTPPEIEDEIEVDSSEPDPELVDQLRRVLEGEPMTPEGLKAEARRIADESASTP